MLPRVAIPTYQRHATIVKKTLKYLNDEGYPPPLIYLFVASEEEKEIYENTVHFYMYGHIVVGEPGLVNQRNFITRFFDDDEVIVCMDDDIERIVCSDFKELVTYGCTLLKERQGGLFGIRPNDDKRLFTYDTTTHLAFIIGSFYIKRNHHDIVLTQEQKHDYEMSILYFLRYKRMYRYSGAGVKTKYFGNLGGLGMNPERTGIMQRCVDALVARYPGACTSKTKKGLPDLLLNWRFRG
jgi:hypothetical protein